MVWKLKNFLCALFSCCLCFVIGFFFYAGNACALSALEGERCFYLDSPSSQGLRKTELEFVDLPRVKGESVTFSLLEFEGGRYALNEETRAMLAKKIAEKFDAEIFVEERLRERVSYYGYSKRLSGGIWVEGKIVNLHIALGEEVCSVGTPIIFDGF